MNTYLNLGALYRGYRCSLKSALVAAERIRVVTESHLKQVGDCLMMINYYSLFIYLLLTLPKVLTT